MPYETVTELKLGNVFSEPLTKLEVALHMEQATKRIIEDLIERVWRNGHIEELANFWTVDCVNHADPGPEKRGLAPLHRYHEGFATWFLDFENVVIEVQQQIVEGDRVATQVLLNAVHTASHQKVSFETIRIDRIFEGKIAEHWSVADMAGLMRQLS